MKKRVQIQNIKPNQILSKIATRKLKGGGEGDDNGGGDADTGEIIVEDVLIV